MVIKSAACLAFMAACLTALPGARAQTAGPYGNPPPAYGNPSQDQGAYVPPPPSRETQAMTDAPQADPSDAPPDRWARQNIIESHRYDRLLKTNRGFREARKVKECSPISDPDLHFSCLASFDHYTPYVGGPTVVGYGSSRAPRHHYRSSYGR